MGDEAVLSDHVGELPLGEIAKVTSIGHQTSPLSHNQGYGPRRSPLLSRRTPAILPTARRSSQRLAGTDRICGLRRDNWHYRKSTHAAPSIQNADV